MLGPRALSVYLSGEIHSDWRDQIMAACEAAGLSIEFAGPVTDHGASDDCGAVILGEEDNPSGATTRARGSMPSAPRC